MMQPWPDWYAPHLAWLRSLGYSTTDDPGDAAPKRADLTRADLTRADLTRADLTRADLTGADLTGADLTGADLTGADLTDADLTDADLTRADLTGADLTRATRFRLSGMPDPATLRLAVADHIEAHPELHNQGSWGDGSADPACGTPCCVAGWACHLGGGSYGLAVSSAATRLLYLAGAPMPDFSGDAAREDIIQALRTQPTEAQS